MDKFMATAPGLVLTLLAGVFADLVDRRRLLLFTQIGAGLSALTLAVLIATGAVQVWMILVLSFVTGCCFAIAGPSYQAFTLDLVERQDLANAIALNSTQFQFSRVIGPTLAGIAIRVFGLAGCFFANAVSFVAVIVSLMMVRFDNSKMGAPTHSVKDRHAVWQDLVEGLRYVRQRPRVFMLIMISGMTSLFGAPYLQMIPFYARDVFHMDQSGNSLLMGASGAGALVGALLLAYMGNFKYKGWSVLSGAFGFALCLIGFALSTTLIVFVTLCLCGKKARKKSALRAFFSQTRGQCLRHQNLEGECYASQKSFHRPDLYRIARGNGGHSPGTGRDRSRALSALSDAARLRHAPTRPACQINQH